MTPPTDLTRPPVVTFDRLASLSDPAALARVLGDISGIDRNVLPGAPSGYSNSSHEILGIVRRDGSRLTLRLKRTHVGEDWIARRVREVPPGREASLLAEPALAGVWDSFVRAHLAFAVEGSEVGLLMEDYSGFVVRDVREPVPVGTEEALLHALASLHARFWDSPALGLPWLSRTEFFCDILGPLQAGDEEALRGAPQQIRDGVSKGWAEALSILPRGVAAKLTLPAEELARPWRDLPRTLIHGDTKLANFAFLPEGRVAAFDWTNLGAAPATFDLGWYLAVNSTRLARGKDALIARYRELLEAALGRAIEEPVWEGMLDAGIVAGARMLLWSKALTLKEGTAFRRDDWAWWVARLTSWSSR